MQARLFTFGPFVLIPEQQALFWGELPVRMGNRAFDILALPLQRAGKLVTKQELISMVWPDAFVDESNLKVHAAALRKALDEDARYLSCIATVIGRGYRFVAPVQTCGKNAWARPANWFFNFPSSSRGFRKEIKASEELGKLITLDTKI
jgi:DNA-binding winged helix-turn-helix (wHTH) protein